MSQKKITFFYFILEMDIIIFIYIIISQKKNSFVWVDDLCPDLSLTFFSHAGME